MEEHKEIFDEFMEIKNTSLKYRHEKTSIENVQEIALNMRYLKEEDILVGKEICHEFDGENLTRMISRISERKFNLMILSHNFPKYDKVEEWFGTEYAKVGEHN